jgi:hypothetical protein
VTAIQRALTVNSGDKSTEDKSRRCAFVKSRTVLVILAEQTSVVSVCLCKALSYTLTRFFC